jgi:hypothetical protein
MYIYSVCGFLFTLHPWHLLFVFSMASSVVFTRISSVAKKVIHFFLCLVAICSSFENFLFSLPAHLLIGLLVLLVLNIWVLYTLQILIPVRLIAGQDFVPLCSLFTWVLVCSAVQKFFNLVQFHLAIVFWVIGVLGRKTLPMPIWKRFSYSSFKVSGFTLRSLIHFELMFVQSRN